MKRWFEIWPMLVFRASHFFSVSISRNFSNVFFISLKSHLIEFEMVSFTVINFKISLTQMFVTVLKCFFLKFWFFSSFVACFIYLTSKNIDTEKNMNVIALGKREKKLLLIKSNEIDLIWKRNKRVSLMVLIWC